MTLVDSSFVWLRQLRAPQMCRLPRSHLRFCMVCMSASECPKVLCLDACGATEGMVTRPYARLECRHRGLCLSGQRLVKKRSLP